MMTTMMPTAHQVPCSPMNGSADDRFATADEMDTATVRT
ncbi:unannotated protein [freshwater metagenome]|uniref:Unannotated protein n=1 Tax=freshwater metagenome TaxID=449393 RepID=A0A6J6URQ1_9ZZZZ